MPRSDVSRAALALCALGFAALSWGLREPERPPATVTRCPEVAEVHGRLLCGDELSVPVFDRCGKAHVLRAGDALRWGSCASPGRMAATDLQAFEVPLDPNRAGLEELQSLPRVGPVLARRIVEGRPYESPDALLRVKGIGPSTLSQMRSRLHFTRESRPSEPRSPPGSSVTLR